MQRVLIETILARIADKLPEFKTVDLYNEQFVNADDGRDNPVRFPALFVSFPDGADYLNKSAGVQESEEVLVRFHIGVEMTTQRRAEPILKVMDLKQKVYSFFQGYAAPFIKTFSRVHEEPDESRGNYYVFLQDYSVGVIDATNWINQGVEHLLTLDLSTEVIINPVTKPGIRTAKDVNDN